MSRTKPYAVDAMLKEAIVLRDKADAANADADPGLAVVRFMELCGTDAVKWLADRLVEVLGQGSSKPPDLDATQEWSTLRYCPELDTFEFMGVMIPRAQVHAIAVMLLRGLDDAEQINHVCDECRQQRGFFVERGFRRCKQCGYPGQ